MSETYRQTIGRKIVSRASANELGAVSDLLFDARRRRISGLVVGHGRKASIVDWESVSGFGPDAIMVTDDAALRDPAGEKEALAGKGKLGLVGTRVLTETGNESGTVTDLVFDPDDGSVVALLVGEREISPDALLGAGTYAVVVTVDYDIANLEQGDGPGGT
jgi:sporulation protein YlmC with PRC-barrel domain